MSGQQRQQSRIRQALSEFNTLMIILQCATVMTNILGWLGLSVDLTSRPNRCPQASSKRNTTKGILFGYCSKTNRPSGTNKGLELELDQKMLTMIWKVTGKIPRFMVVLFQRQGHAVK